MTARLKLNYFTPLPPERTSIAEFSVPVIAALAAHADVTVWTYQAAWTSIAPAGATVRRFDASTEAAPIEAADATFYNMGNDFRYHAAIFEMARRIPGIVILHEPNLQYFFYERARSSPSRRQEYLAFMARDYGAGGVARARRLFAHLLHVDRMVPRYPMTAAALEGALAAVTHDLTVQQQVKRETGLPTFYLPLAYQSRPGPEPPRARHGPPYRLVTFGFMNENRRLDAVARAILSLPQRRQFVWDLYGKFEVKLVPWLLRYRLGEIFRPHGFVSNEALDDAVAAADLAINLRNPTMGEASSTQLKVWGHGVPGLASRAGWYADQPADTLFFVEPGREFDEVAGHLRAFLDDPTPFQEAGRRGRAYVTRTHDPRQYAEGLMAIATSFMAGRRSG